MLLDILKKHFPYLEIIEHEANSEQSVQFRKHGFITDKIYVAIQCKDGIEIYDLQGNYIEVLR